MKPQSAGTVSQQPEAANDTTIDLLELFYRLIASWKLLLAAMVVFAAMGWAYGHFLTVPQYKATATIYVLSNKDSVLNMADLQIGSALTTDYEAVFKVWEVQEQVINNLNLPYSISQMRSRISVSRPSNTRMLNISFTSRSKEEAVLVANEYAKVGSQYIADKMAVDHPSIMSEARFVTVISRSTKYLTAFAGLLGLLLACIFVVVRYLMDDKIRTADDVMKYTGLTNLAAIPAENTQKGGAAHE